MLRSRRRNKLAILTSLSVLGAASLSRGVILVDRADRNTTAPKGTLLDSGWQWEGRWGNFLGTAISRYFFVTAGHVGGNVGGHFILNGKTFSSIATYNDPQGDLQIWKVNKPFSTWAPLFKDSTEVGRGIMVFGRGTQRGDAITVNNQLKGWLWGTDDHVQSWGKNVISNLAKGSDDQGNDVADAQIGWTFDRNGGTYEGAVSSGDSGGGVFVKVGKQWKLVGVNHSTEAEFRYPNDTPAGTYKGALLDVGGLENSDGRLITDDLADNPAHSYATRVSPRMSWIFDVVGGKIAPDAGTASISAGAVPEPGSVVLVLVGAGMLGASRWRRPFVG